MARVGIGIDVLTAARQRISRAFDDFTRVCVSFSAGKDSTVMLHLVANEARRRGRRFGLLLIDLEAQYRLTMDHAEEMFAEYADVAEPYWMAVPLKLRNAVSQHEPRWMCWDPDAEALWVRRPPKLAVTAHDFAPWFRPGMEFEEFVAEFLPWYGQGEPVCAFVGIRTDESLNRWRAIARDDVARHDGLHWTVAKPGGINAYPIYDWRTADIWRYHGKTGLPYNRLYDRMHQAGLTIHQMRICQPYGDDQRKGLWLFHVIEPETWGRVVARVSGANSGALYAQETGSILGRIKVAKPDHLSWEGFARFLLETMPPQMRGHYEVKIRTWLRWWQVNRGYLLIPDSASYREEADKAVPTWRRVCKVLLRHDYWCKGIGFSQTKSDAYDTYRARMAAKQEGWNVAL